LNKKDIQILIRSVYQFVDNEYSAKEFDKNFNWADKKSTITRPMLFSLSSTKKGMNKNNNRVPFQ